LRGGRSSPAQLGEPWIIKLAKVSIEWREAYPEILGEAADRRSSTTAIRHGVGIVPVYVRGNFGLTKPGDEAPVVPDVR